MATRDRRSRNTSTVLGSPQGSELATDVAVLRSDLAHHQETSDTRWEHFLERYKIDQTELKATLDTVSDKLEPLVKLNERGKSVMWVIGIIFTAGAAVASFADKLWGYLFKV